METKGEGIEYRAMVEYLERQKDEKSLKMLNHIKALKTHDDFNAFRWDLKHKALLKAF
jgi:hypothetical protein